MHQIAITVLVYIVMATSISHAVI